MGLLLAFSLVACHRKEQAVEGVAHTAARAEHQAQATATELDQERAQMEQIPLPTKSLYVDIHDPAAWANPFLCSCRHADAAHYTARCKSEPGGAGNHASA